MKSVKEAQVSGKRVILRGDLDVPLKQEAGSRKQEVEDDTRLEALLPTLKYLLENEASVLIIGHLGRPKGRDPEFSLEPVARRLGELVGQEVRLIEDYQQSAISNQQLTMLENIRFWPEEEAKDAAFAKKLAALGDLFVNDSFATCHRDQVSTTGVAKLLPSFAGFKLEEEIRQLGGILKNPERPLVFVMGGAKPETKEPLVSEFAKIADTVLLGGLLMFSQKLEGIPNVIFPIDAVEIYDIGPKSIKKFVGILKTARTIVWNGPVGKWEEPRYERGTRMIANELARMDANVKTIVGGGDIIAALNAFGLLSKMDHVSLAGGAMLEFLAGKQLPGLKALGYYR